MGRYWCHQISRLLFGLAGCFLVGRIAEALFCCPRSPEAPTPSKSRQVTSFRLFTFRPSSSRSKAWISAPYATLLPLRRSNRHADRGRRRSIMDRWPTRPTGQRRTMKMNDLSRDTEVGIPDPDGGANRCGNGTALSRITCGWVQGGGTAVRLLQWRKPSPASGVLRFPGEQRQGCPWEGSPSRYDVHPRILASPLTSTITFVRGRLL